MTDIPSEERCKHELLPSVQFDEDAACQLSAGEIRRRWPRGEDACPVCGVRAIRYASFAHYIAGDW